MLYSMGIKFQIVSIALLYFVFVFFMSYGHLNSGLVFGRYGVLLVIATTIAYFLLKQSTIIRFKSIIEYWYIGSVFFVFALSVSTFNPVIMLSGFNYFIYSIFLFILINSLLFFFGISLIEVFSKINLIIACVAILVGLYVMNIGDIKLLSVTIEYDLFFSKRMNSWFNNSTVLGLYICICFCFLFYLNNKGAISALLYWMVCILFIIGLVLSGGRTGAFLTVIALINMKLRFSLSTFVGIVILCGFSLLLINNFDFLKENIFFMRRLMNSFESGLGGRDDKLDFSLQLLNTYDLRSILLGTGIGSVQLLHNYSVHSGLFRQFLELGTPFTILNFLIGLYIAVYSKVKNSPNFNNEFKLVSTLLLVLIIADTMVTSLWGVSLMSFFYCLAICTFIHVINKRETGVEQ